MWPRRQSGNCQRQSIARAQRTTVEPAELAARMCRDAAEHRRDLKTAGDGEDGAHPVPRGADREALACSQIVRFVGRNRPAVDADSEVRARQCDADIGAGAGERGPCKGDFERGRLGLVANQRIGGCEPNRIHHARRRNAEALEAAAAKILEGGSKTGFDDFEMDRHCAAQTFTSSLSAMISPVSAARSSAANSVTPIGWNRRRSPARNRKGSCVRRGS